MLKFFSTLIFLFTLSSISFAEDMTIKLPDPKAKGTLSLEETIAKRRSMRDLLGESLTLQEISQLLWSCQGITDKEKSFRTSPSAGATYPLEVYFASGDGLFHYIPESHQIKRLKDTDLRSDLSMACYGQDFVKRAAIDIIITADFKRTTSYYGDRGRNYVYIEVGHAAQNLHLQAVSIGLGSVPIGAFSDDKVKEILTLPDNLTPIYIIPVGYVK